MQTQAADAQVKAEAPEKAPEDASQPQQEQELQPQPQQSGWSQKLSYAQENFYDEAAWNSLLDFAEDSGDLEKIKEAYEALLQKYPNTVRIFIFILFNLILCVTPNPRLKTCFPPVRKVVGPDIIFEPLLGEPSDVPLRRGSVRSISENISFR